MRVLTLGFVGALLCTSTVEAQVVSPLPDPFAPFTVGQPSLTGLAPVGIGMVPPPVLAAAGNPFFAIAPITPPMVSPGSPTALLFVLSLAPPVPAPPLPYCGYVPAYPFGIPEIAMTPPLVTAAGGAAFTSVFAGVTGPFGAPPPPVPLPLPPGLPVGMPGIIVLTIGVDSMAGCLFATDGVRLGTI